MDKFQIAEIFGEQAHAGSKAPNDVRKIAQDIGFTPCYIKTNDLKTGLVHKLNRQREFAIAWPRVYKAITEKSIVVLQQPFGHKYIFGGGVVLQSLKRKKQVRFITVVHDVEELRTLGNDAYHKREFERMMKIADILIVHNDVMRDFFIKKGFDENRIVTLGIFDYLQEKRKRVLPTFDKSVIIAGNLDLRKSGYLKNLPELKCKFRLYGPNYSIAEAPNITYGGVLSPDHVPDVLTSGFGLIWDGDSIETCKGGTGEYLRYNNPHKLSLYLSSGLPVIIWKEAAEAGFVEENHVGYTIDSLYDIPKIMNTISAEEYRDIAENVKKIAGKMVDGGYMRDALETAVGLVEL